MKNMLKNLLSMFVELYLRDILNGLLNMFLHKSEFDKLNSQIQCYIKKTQNVLIYLESLNKKIEDGSISDDEFNSLSIEGKELISKLVKK